MKDKTVWDVIIFGSAIKGKALPGDIDAAIISDKQDLKVEGAHVSIVSPRDFFGKVPTIITTLIREGFSLRQDKSLSECWRFNSGVLFSYQLSGLDNSKKVKVVNALRGKGERGTVAEKGGEWISQGVFVVPVNAEHIFDGFFRNFGIKYKKRFVLMH
ncbi:MAG: hypothetical protein KKD18_05580 [Nanoarchaeota archaeon]|nr:hypothetical protein [Nanoarchaeota archaeon]